MQAHPKARTDGFAKGPPKRHGIYTIQDPLEHPPFLRQSKLHFQGLVPITVLTKMAYTASPKYLVGVIFGTVLEAILLASLCAKTVDALNEVTSTLISP
jgi:hypothetical protein